MCLAPSVAYGARYRKRRGPHRRRRRRRPLRRCCGILYCAGGALARAATRRDATRREDITTGRFDVDERCRTLVPTGGGRRCTREKTERLCVHFSVVAWDEDEAMDAWMYDVVSAVCVTAPDESSLFRSSCAISWLCLRDVRALRSVAILQFF